MKRSNFRRYFRIFSENQARTVLRLFCIVMFNNYRFNVSGFETTEFPGQVEIMDKMLGHLKFTNLPNITLDDYSNFQVPSEVMKRYDALVWKHEVKSGFRNKIKRNKRSNQPSLAGLFSSVQQKSEISGDIVYSGIFREKLKFEMEGRIPSRSRITLAQLRLFKKLPNFNHRFSSISRFRTSPSTNRHEQKSNVNRWRPTPIRHARVSVFHTLTNADGTERSNLVDSRLIIVNGSGWQSFDITKAVKQWQKHPVKYMSIVLELRIEGARPGKAAAEIARMVRFTSQQVSHTSPRRPELVVFTEEKDQIRNNDCSLEAKRKQRRCCRSQHYVSFRDMAWTKHWIIEPAGYEAFNCGGRCSPSRRKTSPGVPRTCAVVESAPLPVMYLVKRGDKTEVEISEFPNMIVEKCGCSLDSVFVE